MFTHHHGFSNNFPSSANKYWKDLMLEAIIFLMIHSERKPFLVTVAVTAYTYVNGKIISTYSGVF